jgi:hypothetical protein
MTLTPQSRSVEMLRLKAGWRARAAFGQGTVTIGRPRPIASLSSPSASVSLIPADAVDYLRALSGCNDHPDLQAGGYPRATAAAATACVVF